MHSDLDPAKPKDLTESTARPKWFREFGVAIEPSVVKASAYAAMVGFIVGLVAQGLLELIYLFTNLFFYGKWSFAVTYPVHHHLGAWVILIPPVGGLLVGILVHFWEPTLKGHGIPEVMEAVLDTYAQACDVLLPGVMYGRATGTVVERNTCADRRHQRPSPPRGL